VVAHVGRFEIEFAGEQLDHLVAHPLLHLEAHGAAETSATQLQLHRGEQVVGLLLFEGEVDVAGDAERPAVLHHHAREQQVEVRGDDLLDGHVPHTVAQRDEPREDVGHLHPGEAPLAGLRIRHHGRQAERQVGDVRERMSGVDRQRGEHREDAAFEHLGQFDPVGDAEVVPSEHVHAHLGERRYQRRPPELLLAGHHHRHRVAHHRQLLGRRETVGRADRQADGSLVLQRGDTHLEELVEVARADGDELHPLEQRDARLGSQ
jgi:hypothetical protein